MKEYAAADASASIPTAPSTPASVPANNPPSATPTPQAGKHKPSTSATPIWLSSLTSLHLASPSLGTGIPWVRDCTSLTSLQLAASCLTSLQPLRASGCAAGLQTLAFHYAHARLSEPDLQTLASCESLRSLRLQHWVSLITAPAADAIRGGPLGDAGELFRFQNYLPQHSMDPVLQMAGAAAAGAQHPPPPSGGIRRALDLDQPLPLLPLLQALHISLRTSHQLHNLQHLSSLTALHFGLGPSPSQGWDPSVPLDNVCDAWGFVRGLPLLRELHVLQGSRSLPLVQDAVTLLHRFTPRLYSLQYSGMPGSAAAPPRHPAACASVAAAPSSCTQQVLSPNGVSRGQGGGSNSDAAVAGGDGGSGSSSSVNPMEGRQDVRDRCWPDLSSLTALRVLALGSGPHLHASRNDGAALPLLDIRHIPQGLLRLSLYGTALLLLPSDESPDAARLPSELELCSMKDCDLRRCCSERGSREASLPGRKFWESQAGLLCRWGVDKGFEWAMVQRTACLLRVLMVSLSEARLSQVRPLH